jgi:predicted DNA-binding protein with PD1-like motif
MKTLLRSLLGAAGAAVAAASSGCSTPATADAPAVRWLHPSEAGPRGHAPGAQHRLVASHADGSRDFVLILSAGDEVQTALADLAQTEGIVGAHYTALGGVRDPEVAWFDLNRKQYKAMSMAEQMEVLTLTGDIGTGDNGKPIVHTHLVLGREDGRAFGGHLVRATASPTVEIFVTSYPKPLRKRHQAETDLQLFDLSAP